LAISLSTVKKAWISIYHRVEHHLPDLMADPLRSDTPPSGRGKEKRRRLLAYLRDHPEELRPYSQRLAGAARKRKSLRRRSFQKLAPRKAAGRDEADTLRDAP